MAVQRSTNFLGQERVDAPLLRLVDSGTRADFDALGGNVLSGKLPLVVRGFTVGSFSVGAMASNLQLDVQGGVVLHYNASASGTVFVVPQGRTIEQLSSTVNARVTGSFLPSSQNYVGLDFRRAPDDSTAATATFYDPDLPGEVQRRVPLGQTADYQIVISPEPFEATPVLCPVAIVTTDAANGVTAVQDARNLWGRLGAGGSVPDDVAYWPWPQGRKEVAGQPFIGGDKAIESERDWKLAMMTRVWEIGGGERWCSAVADRNLKMVLSGTPFASNSQYFEWVGGNLHWKGLSFLLSNSTGTRNDVADQIANSAGLTNLVDGDCVYVDLDYRATLTGGSALVAAKAPIASLGAAEPPLSRTIIAWRFGSQVFTRDTYGPVGNDLIFVLQAAISSEPLVRRARAHVLSGSSVTVEPLGKVLVTDGGQLITVDHSTQTTFDAAVVYGGAFASNTRYYVYVFSNLGSPDFEVSVTAPDDQLRYKNGTTTHAFVTTFFTNSGGAQILQYAQVPGEYQYWGRTATGGGVGGNLVLDGGSSLAPVTVTLAGPVPTFAKVAVLTARIELAGGTTSLAEVRQYNSTSAPIKVQTGFGATFLPIPFFLGGEGNFFCPQSPPSFDYVTGDLADKVWVWAGGFKF